MTVLEVSSQVSLGARRLGRHLSKKQLAQSCLWQDSKPLKCDGLSGKGRNEKKRVEVH